MELRDVTVREVEPAAVPAGAPRGQWQCCSCAAPYPVEDGFKVLYDTLPGVSAVAYVCPACAEAARRG